MEPQVVHGVAVASPYGNPTPDGQNWTKGEKQPKACNDVIWGVLFYAQLVAVIAVMVSLGIPAITDDATKDDFYPYIQAASALGAFAFFFSGLGLLILMACANVLIKIALWFAVIMSLVWGVVAFLSGQYFMGVLFLLSFLIGLCYIKAVWSRIPFATVNLITSITAVKKNFGVVFVSYFMSFLGWIWAIFWTAATMGMLQRQCGTAAQCQAAFPYGQFFGLLVSYFWTLQVVMNVIHVTVAGVVSTWWFTPDEADCCCSGAVIGSYLRSMTSSFGSICLGSLIVAVVEALKQLAYAARQNDDGNAILLCLAECILACISSMIQYFNKWAYIYVGVYGYSYCEAGQTVTQLFADRGWEAIVADNLVSNALSLVTLVVGLITGAVGYLLGVTTDWFSGLNATLNSTNEAYMLFVIGFIIGLMLCAITLSVIGSGVNTVIVCFADGPAEFQSNHPELSNKMRETWIAAFPGCM